MVARRGNSGKQPPSGPRDPRRPGASGPERMPHPANRGGPHQGQRHPAAPDQYYRREDQRTGLQPVPISKMQRVARQREQRPMRALAPAKPRSLHREHVGSGGVLKAIGQLFWGLLGWQSPTAADLPHMRMGLEAVAQKLARGERPSPADIQLLKAVAALVVSRAGQGAAIGWQFWELYRSDPLGATAQLLTALREFETDAAADAQSALQAGAGRRK